VALQFVPDQLRKHVWAIYAFARSADDFADEPGFEGARSQALDRWEELLEQAFRREVQHPIFLALRRTVREFNIPLRDLKALLTAYRVDLQLEQVRNYRQLREYCGLSASPIGRIALALHGHHEAKLQRFSDELCAGVQIANQLQNLRSDLSRGRCYLPLEDLMHFGVTPQQLASGEPSPELEDLLRFSVARARMLLSRGEPLVRRVGPRLAAELEVTLQGATRILDRLDSQGYAAQGGRSGSARGGFDLLGVRTAFGLCGVDDLKLTGA
jgi:squalene synthase HpnC